MGDDIFAGFDGKTHHQCLIAHKYFIEIEAYDGISGHCGHLLVKSPVDEDIGVN